MLWNISYNFNKFSFIRLNYIKNISAYQLNTICILMKNYKIVEY